MAEGNSKMHNEPMVGTDDDVLSLTSQIQSVWNGIFSMVKLKNLICISAILPYGSRISCVLW
jgi:hypothetical protein